jgi:hypothetical protein
MVVTDTFAKFGRRMSATQGCPYVVIAETPNPIRQLEYALLRERAQAMLPVVIDGLTLPPEEIQRRMRSVAREEIHPSGVVRAAAPV